MHGTAAENCPSCGTAFAGPYCYKCGEERMDAHAWTWAHFTHHLIHELAHVDSKIFRSFWLLVSKPGFLTAEYWEGRRVLYLRPFRIYLIAAAVHFLALHYGWFRMDMVKIDRQEASAQTLVEAAAKLSHIDPSRYAELTARFESIYKFALYLGPVVLAGISWLAFRKHREYFIQHLILAMHVYSFWFLLSSLSGPLLALRGLLALVTTVYLFYAARRLFGGSAKRNIGRAIGLLAAHAFGEFVVIAVTTFVTIATAILFRPH